MQVVSVRYRNESAAIELENGETLSLPLDFVLEMRLSSGRELSPDQLVLVYHQASFFSCRSHAFRFLSLRDRSRKELQRKLIEKKYDPEIVKEVVTDFEHRGYLDDREFSRKFIESAQRKKVKGPNLLKKQLMEKGVERQIAEDAMKEYGAYDIDFEDVLALSLKKIRTYKKESNREQKLAAFLMRRGFDSGMVFRIIRKIRELNVHTE